MVRSFCSAPAVLKNLLSWYREVGQKGQPDAENAPVVGDFPARTDDARSARASDVEDATVPRARRRVWRLVHEQMNGRDALGSAAAKPRSQFARGEKARKNTDRPSKHAG